MNITPLSQETRSIVTTREAAFHLNRKEQTLRGWACTGKGPLKPVNMRGRLGWRVEDLRKVVGDHV